MLSGGQLRRACKLARRAFHDRDGRLADLQALAEFAWTGQADMTQHPREAAYELARTRPVGVAAARPRQRYGLLGGPATKGEAEVT
jgi:hypothetical protein